MPSEGGPAQEGTGFGHGQCADQNTLHLLSQRAKLIPKPRRPAARTGFARAPSRPSNVMRVRAPMAQHVAATLPGAVTAVLSVPIMARNEVSAPITAEDVLREAEVLGHLHCVRTTRGRYGTSWVGANKKYCRASSCSRRRAWSA